MTELTPTERVAWLAWELAEGCTFTNQQVADLFGISVPGAWLMLNKIARVRPITTTVLDARGTLMWHKMRAE